MLGRLWDDLFAYADELKEEIRKAEKERPPFDEMSEEDLRYWATLLYDERGNNKLDAVRHVESLLTEAFDEAEAFKVRIEKEPEDKFEEAVLSIPGLQVFRDPQDKQIFYEMDGRHFDRPEECVKALIKYRNKNRKAAMTQTKKELLTHISEMMDSISLADLDNKKSSTIIKGRRIK